MSMQDPLGYYKILDLTPEATDIQIKQNYRELAKVWHPDHNTSPEAIEKFQKISVAYDVLQDSTHRLFYDLLSQVYSYNNFPDMFALSSYKDRAGHENPFVRTISQQTVVGKIYKTSFQQHAEICSALEAPSLVLKNSISNWLLGWWGIKAFVQNIRAISYNYNSINRNRSENLALLVHNAVAYYQENKMDKASISALQAQEYANSEQQILLDKFIRLTGFNSNKLRFPIWNYNKLKLLQLVAPFVISLMILLPIVERVVINTPRDSQEITYFQTVKFNNGGQTFDDVVVSKVMNIPVNYDDNSKLYHVKSNVDVRYGPADEFEVLSSLASNHTIRITGYTPDNKWYRIMIDSGEMGFVKAQYLRQGIGNPIKENSKIISH